MGKTGATVRTNDRLWSACNAPPRSKRLAVLDTPASKEKGCSWSFQGKAARLDTRRAGWKGGGGVTNALGVRGGYDATDRQPLFMKERLR